MPDSNTIRKPIAEVGTLQRFLAEASWSLGVRAHLLEWFNSLGDVPGVDYVAREIVAEAKAIEGAVRMLKDAGSGR